MGVTGLLPCLRSITRLVSLEGYRGLTVAVDAMSWLHKGVFASDVKTLARSQRGEIDSVSAEKKCAQYAVKKAHILQEKFGLKILMVIDGDSLPSKKEENERRLAEREKSFEQAISAETIGDTRTARKFYARSCSITCKIKYELIRACKEFCISFIVAPFEADAQLARLAHIGVADLVLTEDSDILAYGCPRAVFKVDFERSQGFEIQMTRDIGKNESPSFRNWTHDMFVFMCILSGCDYCKGIPGLGIKKAHKIVRVNRTPSKIFSALRAAGKMRHSFEDEFWIAFRTFRHQLVFCPSKNQIEPLWPISSSENHLGSHNLWPFLGAHIESDVAIRIANGSLHPSTKNDWETTLKNQFQKYTSSFLNTAKAPLSSELSNTIENRKVMTAGDETQNEIDPTITKISNKAIFSFFPSRKKRERNNALEVSNDGVLEWGHSEGVQISRHPYLGLKKARTIGISRPYEQSTSVFRFDYSSHNIGEKFETLSRKHMRRKDAGTKSSQFVQKIWNNRYKYEWQGRSDQGVTHNHRIRKKTEKSNENFKRERSSKQEGIFEMTNDSYFQNNSNIIDESSDHNVKVIDGGVDCKMEPLARENIQPSYLYDENIDVGFHMNTSSNLYTINAAEFREEQLFKTSSPPGLIAYPYHHQISPQHFQEISVSMYTT